MKDNEKQIEEIYSLLFCDKWEQPFTECSEDIRCIDCIARKLYDLGYRKIDKDSVVLSAKQCVTIVQDNYDIGYERGSKETAREIFKDLKEKLKGYIGLNYLDELAKQFGVEVDNEF